MNLKNDFTLDDLNRSFRLLVKTYHPDKNPEHQDWAHEKMVVLNNSYKLLLEYRSNHPLDTLRSHEPEEEKTDPAFPYYFSEAIQLFLSGLCLYFEYGLDNPLLRKEGTRRFRFREAVKIIFKSIEIILEIKKMDLSKENRQPFEATMRLILLFYQDLKNEHPMEKQDSFERQLIANNKLLSQLMRSALLPDNGRRIIITRDNLYLCYMTYIKLVKSEPGELRKKTIMMKVSLLDSLMNFIEAKNSGALTPFFD